MVYNVTTWEQFLRAFTIAHDPEDTENDVIEVTADIDCNDITLSNPIYAGAIKTINGNNHTFYNLHDGTSKSSPLIRCGDGSNHPNYDITWNKLNFDNLFIVLSSYGAFWGASGKSMVFNDCTFVCQCAVEVFRYCTLNRCAVTFENISASNRPFEYVTSNFCWYNVKIRKSSTADTNRMFGTMNTCYIEGKILCPASHAGSLGTLTNCCVNIQTDVPMYRISSAQTGIIPLSIYNSDKVPSVTQSDANVIAVTDAQMHDASYLESIGFAIIAQAGE